MITQNRLSAFFLYFIIICLVVCRADVLFSATVDESKPIVIEARDVQSSVESYLEVIAINGQEITPTAYPEVNLGDVITVRVRVQNAYPGTLKLLQCGATWGTGLVYRGQLTGQNVLYRFDDEIQKVIIDIDAIPGDPDQAAVVGKRLTDSARWYSFDLKVAGCENLAIHVLTDELYSCQFEKTYYLAARITTPEIRYTVSLSPQQVLSGEKQQAVIAINNVGDGRAFGVVMETNLEKFSAMVSRVSPGFAYDPETGNFIGGDIAPGQAVTLRFDLVAGKGGGSPPEAAVLFHPVYTDVCGFRLQAPEELVALRPAGEETQPGAWGADLGLAVALALPEVVEDCKAQEAVVTITKTRPADYYDLDIVLDTGNYEYLGDLTTTGFDGLAPLAHTGRPGVVVLSFDKDRYRTEPLSQGGTLRFKLRKKCRTPAEMKASIRFVDRLAALTAERETPPDQPLNLLKREINTFADPMARQSADLALRVMPECCRMEAGELMPWTVYVTNRGNGTAFDVGLEDLLAEHVTFQEEPENTAGGSPQIEQDTPTPGKTTLTWNLGDIPPSQTRKVNIAARTLADTEASGYPVNTSLVRVVSGCAGDACQDKEMTAPCFILPDDCVSDVYEKPEKLHGFLALAYLYKSNLYETYKNPKGVWATYITPGLWVALPASHERLVEIATTSATPGGLAVSPFFPKNDRRYQAYLLYSPQLEIYHHENENNMLTHRVDGYFHYNSQNRFSLQLIDQYKRAHDSVSSRRYDIEDKYRTNLFSAVSTLGLTEKIELRLDYSNFLVNYDDSDNRINDRVDNSWALYGYFRLTDKTWAFAEYEYADLNYRNYFLDSAEDRYFAGIRWEITEKTSGQIKGGYGFRDYDADGLSDVDTWMAEVIIDYDLTEKTRIVANAYRRYEESMGEGLHWDNSFGYTSTNMLTHMFGLSLNYDLTSKLHLNLHGTLFYDEYAYEYDDDLWEGKKQRDREFAISPTIKLDFLKWLTFDLAYTYTHVDCNYSEGEFEDHTVILRGTIYR